MIELKQRPGSWERLCAELRRRVGKQEMEVSVVQPGCTVELLTETTWASISDTKQRLVLMIQPDSLEETLSLEMTGLRKRDRKYSEVSRTIARLKVATDSFDKKMEAWFSHSGQIDIAAALVFTYYQAPAGMRISDEFPYLTAEGAGTATVWRLWVELTAEMHNLDATIGETAKHIQVVANKRAIKRIGLFKKSTINSSIAKAQENNVKMSLAQEILASYTQNLCSLQTVITSVVSRLRTKALQRPEMTRSRSALGDLLSLCVQ